MYIFNISTLVSYSILENWLPWQKEQNIMEIMDTGCFTEYKFTQLLDQDESEGQTFVTQFIAESLLDYERFLNQYDALFREKALEKWADQFISFRTLMKIL